MPGNASPARTQIPTPQNAARPAPNTPRALPLLLASALLALSAAACAPTLLSPNEKRTPFDAYDRARDRHAPQYVENEFGGRVPNLRARLSPNR